MNRGIVVAICIIVFGLLATWWMRRDDWNTSENDAKRDSGTLEEHSERVMEKIAKTVHTIAAYQSPAGEEKIGFVLGVDSEGVIVDAQIEEMAENPVSRTRQESFGGALSERIVGKKLLDLSDIDEIGGAPLTTDAFNESLPELRSQLLPAERGR